MQKEIWKDVPDYEGLYQVSNFGNVRSIKNGCYLVKKLCLHGKGYYATRLSKLGVIKFYRVHQLVAMAFLNHKPCGMKLVVDHINGIKTDNRPENLQLLTNRENAYRIQGNNTSSYKGVCWDERSKRWRSVIRIEKQKKHLGYFKCEIKAHLAYQKALKELV